MVEIFDLLGRLEKGEEYKVNNNGTEYLISGESITAMKCRKCGIWREISEYNKEKRGFAGRRSCCKHCRSEYLKQWRQINWDRTREYRSVNADKYKENKIKWRKENAEQLKEWEKGYREKNREKIRLKEARREAVKRALPGNMSEEEMINTSEYFEGKCALSGEIDVDLHFDHVVPLSTGHGGTVCGNIVPIASTLNTSKSDSNIFEWFETNRQRFELTQERFDKLISFLAEANEMAVDEYRDYVYWCHDNQRTADEVKADNRRYMYQKTSVEIWSDQR